ncbi:MAG: hypothetical protein PW792_06365 [Acidobacteriaceae bacterium]|nr:hypothetical protein [Acidobacteriaceae bacterium]
MAEMDLQRRTLRLYGELLARESSWAGKLVVTAGEGCSATGLCAAVAIAGGTCLAIDPDAKAVRSIFREGGVDFVVNTLDEALRVLKNEVRQGRPLGVALTADVEAVLVEFRERGVLAELAVEAASFPAKAYASLPVEGSEELSVWLAARGWQEALVPRDAGWVFAEDDPRWRWVRGIARYQRSASRESRAVWLSEAELSNLSRALE